MSKNEADNVKKISTSFLKKYGYFNGRRSGTIIWTREYDEHKDSVNIEVLTHVGNDYLRISYIQTDNYSGERKDFDYKIPLATTPCRFGGKRYWFVCPWYKNGVYCGKRVSTLYKDGDYFACRHCYNLTYNSRKVNRRYKMFPLFNVLTLRDKIEKLHSQIKHPYYRGRPTRKQRQLEKLYEMAEENYERYSTLKDKNML